MGRSFQIIHASSVGNFESNTTKIPKWIVANGGTYSKDVVAGVTHLIATREAFVKDVPAVAAAKMLGTVKIVSYFWLTESLMSKSHAPRAAKEYLWANILKDEKSKSRAAKVQKKKVPADKSDGDDDKAKNSAGNRSEQGASEAAGQSKAGQKKKSPKASDKKANSKSAKKTRKKRVTDKHRLYEVGGAKYSAKLVRPANTAHGTNETVYLKIYENIKAPHTYATHIRLTRRGFSKTKCLAPLESDLNTAMRAFKDCFEAQVGKEWEDRLNGVAPSPRRDDDGNLEPPHRGWFWLESEHVSGLASLFREEYE